jgi:hypothetical protein
LPAFFFEEIFGFCSFGHFQISQQQIPILRKRFFFYDELFMSIVVQHLVIAVLFDNSRTELVTLGDSLSDPIYKLTHGHLCTDGLGHQFAQG